MPTCKNCGEPGNDHNWKIREPYRGRCPVGEMKYVPDKPKRMSVFKDKDGNSTELKHDRKWRPNPFIRKLGYKHKK